jgi:hypothetical protein
MEHKAVNATDRPASIVRHAGFDFDWIRHEWGNFAWHDV